MPIDHEKKNYSEIVNDGHLERCIVQQTFFLTFQIHQSSILLIEGSGCQNNLGMCMTFKSSILWF